VGDIESLPFWRHCQFAKGCQAAKCFGACVTLIPWIRFGWGMKTKPAQHSVKVRSIGIQPDIFGLAGWNRPLSLETETKIVRFCEMCPNNRVITARMPKYLRSATDDGTGRFSGTKHPELATTRTATTRFDSMAEALVNRLYSQPQN
jgi:CTP synthase (UTP-ammonia lyase)